MAFQIIRTSSDQNRTFLCSSDRPKVNRIQKVDVSSCFDKYIIAEDLNNVSPNKIKVLQRKNCCGRTWVWIKRGISTSLAVIGLSFTDLYTTEILHYYFHTNYGTRAPKICSLKLNVSNSSLLLLWKIFAEPGVRLNLLLRNAFAIDKVSEFLCSALAEEIMYRGLLQHGLLRDLPKMILKKTAPKYIHIPDHLSVRITRVALVSIFFALGHVENLNADMSVLPQLCSGILLGTATEITDSIKIPILVHFLSNLILFAKYKT